MQDVLTAWNPQPRPRTLRSAQDVTRLHADALCHRLTRRLIRYLQSRTDCRLSGDDTVLANIWDEVCVQIQHEESFYWDVYEETMSLSMFWYLQELTDYDQLAIWLQTDDGWSWQWDIDNDSEEIEGKQPDFLLDDLVTYILRKYVYQEAERWSNRRITAYIDSQFWD